MSRNSSLTSSEAKPTRALSCTNSYCMRKTCPRLPIRLSERMRLLTLARTAQVASSAKWENRSSAFRQARLTAAPGAC